MSTNDRRTNHVDIRRAAVAGYKLARRRTILPDPWLKERRVSDRTPALVSTYALNRQQALLASVRHNRLLDYFTGMICHSLQSGVLTRLGGCWLTTDEVYVGIDRRGVHYVFPVQAKGGRDRLGIVQIEQDIQMCGLKFPNLVCRPIGAQFMAGDLIALFELEETEDGVAKAKERHYRLVPPGQVSVEDLGTYSNRTD